MKVLVLNYPEALDALFEEGVDAVEVTDIGEDALINAGVGGADAFVVKGGGNAVQIPVALHINPGLRTVIIGDDIPDYVRGTADLILSTEVGTPEAVVDALL